MKELIYQKIEEVTDILKNIKTETDNESVTRFLENVSRIEDALKQLKDLEFNITLIERFEKFNWMDGITDLDQKCKLAEQYHSMAFYLMQNTSNKVIDLLCYPTIKILLIENGFQKIDCEKLYKQIKNFVKSYVEDFMDDSGSFSENMLNELFNYLKLNS